MLTPSRGVFGGLLYFDETVKHYNYFRDYDPSLGRYVESDPVGLKGGINTYGYVGGKSLLLIDPRGLDNPGMGAYGPAWSLPWDIGYSPSFANCSHYPPGLRDICLGSGNSPNMNCARKCLAVYYRGIGSLIDGAFWVIPQHPVCWLECKTPPLDLCKGVSSGLYNWGFMAVTQ